MVEMPPFDEAFRAQVARAREAERAADLTEPRARNARYDRSANRIVVELKSGAGFSVPTAMLPELQGAAPDELARVEPVSGGEGLGWDDLDVHVSVAGILARMLGPEMVRAFARRGGRATSERKAAAARANGARGGRPRKQPEPVRFPPNPDFGQMKVAEVRQERPASPPPPAEADPE